MWRETYIETLTQIVNNTNDFENDSQGNTTTTQKKSFSYKQFVLDNIH